MRFKNLQIYRLPSPWAVSVEALHGQLSRAETASEQFDADFALMTGELRRLLPQILGALGGEAPAA